MSWLTTALFALAIFALVWALGSPDRHPTGPARIPLAVLAWFFITKGDEFWMTLFSKYGKVARVMIPFWGDYFILLGPEMSRPYFSAVKELSMEQGSLRILGPFFPPDFEKTPHGVKIISLLTNRLMASPDFMQRLQRNVDAALERGAWKAGGVLEDLFQWTPDMTLDLIFDLYFKVDVGNKYHAQLKHYMMLLDPERQLSNPRFLWARKDLARETQAIFAEFTQLLGDISIDRLRDPGNLSDTDGIVQAINAAAEMGISETLRIVVCIVWVVTFAALVNTQATLGWLLTRIAADQNLADKVLAEQLEVLGPDSSNTTPTLKDLSRMLFLDACIAENIRLTNPTTSFRLTTSPLTVDNFTIPPGNLVFFPHASVHWNPTLYPEPQSFNPGRKFPSDGARARGGQGECAADDGVTPGVGPLHSNYYMAMWGLGAHPCVGAKFAIAVLKTIVGTVVRRYHLELVEGTWPQIPKGVLGSIATQKPTNKVQIRLTPRFK